MASTSTGNTDAAALRSGPPLRKLFGPFGRVLSRNRQDKTKSGKGPEEIPVLTVSGEDAEKENKDRRRDVNSLPPWLHSLHQGETVDEVDGVQDPLLTAPPVIKPAHHNNTPSDPKSQQRLQAGRGRTWNHLRTKEAVTMPYHPPGHVSRWQAFADSSAYHREADEEKSHLVGDDWLEKNMPELNEPWQNTDAAADTDPTPWLFSPSKRTRSIDAFQRALMRNAFVPLIFRMTVLVFTLAAFALGIQIYNESNRLNGSPQARAGTLDPGSSEGDYICEQQTSTYMAFIVNIIASVYILYITVDEYRSPPLGLRKSRTKLRLLFLDLWFIIFSAANLSLAFNTLTDEQWSCYGGTPLDTNNNNEEAARSTCVQSTTLCHRQRGLVSVLLIAEIAWVTTFAISVLRVVERISR